MSTSIIVCTSPWGRLKVGNRYVWVDFHEYCGPSFYTDAAMSKLYDPKDENDPVWEQFDHWLKKYRAGKEKQAQKRAAASGVPPCPPGVYQPIPRTGPVAPPPRDLNAPSGVAIPQTPADDRHEDDTENWW